MLANHFLLFNLGNKFSLKEQMFYRGVMTELQVSKRRWHAGTVLFNSGLAALSLHRHHRSYSMSLLVLLSFYCSVTRVLRTS